ncbi:hypothetical protein J6590_069620 [Homalodisca vitripennis]|nr:hypothetical protein J6590_069620 [Homalodisca vitripennis]
MDPGNRRVALRGCMGVTLVSTARDDKAKIQTATTRGYLQNNAILALPPNFMNVTFLFIRKREQDSLSQHFKRLLIIVLDGEPSNFTSLMLATALMSVANSSFERDMRTTLNFCSAQIGDASIDEFVALYPGFARVNINDLTRFNGMEASHYVFSLCLMATLIGKALTEVNYTAWMERRIRSFSTPLGLAAQDMLTGDLQPPLAFCQRFNAEVKVFWRVRRLFFMNILGMSSRSDLLAQGMRVTRTLLRGAELSNWIYILHWIILLNPDLLMWNELSKFIPMLVAASLKYAELGELAPWCKLILPIEELTEFRADNLNVPYAVAQGIASEFGTGSNLKCLQVVLKRKIILEENDLDLQLTDTIYTTEDQADIQALETIGADFESPIAEEQGDKLWKFYPGGIKTSENFLRTVIKIRDSSTLSHIDIAESRKSGQVYNLLDKIKGSVNYREAPSYSVRQAKQSIREVRKELEKTIQTMETADFFVKAQEEEKEDHQGAGSMVEEENPSPISQNERERSRSDLESSGEEEECNGNEGVMVAHSPGK